MVPCLWKDLLLTSGFSLTHGWLGDSHYPKSSRWYLEQDCRCSSFLEDTRTFFPFLMVFSDQTDYLPFYRWLTAERRGEIQRWKCPLLTSVHKSKGENLVHYREKEMGIVCKVISHQKYLKSSTLRQWKSKKQSPISSKDTFAILELRFHLSSWVNEEPYVGRVCPHWIWNMSSGFAILRWFRFSQDGCWAISVPLHPWRLAPGPLWTVQSADARICICMHSICMQPSPPPIYFKQSLDDSSYPAC